MIAEQLRKSVLQAAIQGKLTEQLPGDGDARDLLKEIQKEKTRLIREGKIKREKPLHEITDDEIPFDIPENWSWVRLSEIAKAISAGGDKPSVFSKIKTKEINVLVISNGKKDKGIFGFTNKAIISEVCITISGRGTIGYSCVREEPFVPIVRLITVIPFHIINPFFLEIACTSLLEIGVGTSIQQLTIPMISPKLIPLPPLAEQNRIVNRIRKLEQQIDNLEMEETKLDALQKSFPKKMKDSILQFAIRGKLTEQQFEDGDARDLMEEILREKNRLIKEDKIKKEKPLPVITEDEIPFDIPENWIWVRFSDLVHFNMGKTPSRQDDSYWEKNIPWISIADMPSNEVVQSTKESISNKAFDKIFHSNIVPAGTLIMSFKLTVGRVSFIGMDAVHNEAIISIFPFLSNDIVKEYLFKVLPKVSQWGNSKDAIKGKTLNSSSLNNLLIPLPPIIEQRRIIDRLEQLLPLCNTLD